MFEGLEVPKFDGDNYARWSIMMKHFLISKGLWKTIEDGYEELTWSMLQGKEKRDKKEK